MAIGTLRAGALHEGLKEWYVLPGDLLEERVDGYVIDIVRGDLLIEIQTGNFAAIRRKLEVLTEHHPVRLVYPVAAEKWIIRLGPDGHTLIDRRRSPKRGSVLDLFHEMVHVPHLARRDIFSVEVVLARIEEVRVNDGRGSWRRRGWSITDQRLLEVMDRVVLGSVGDFRALLPADLPDPFTVRELAESLNERITLARKMAYCLRGMGAIEMVGKQGRAYQYRASRL